MSKKGKPTKLVVDLVDLPPERIAELLIRVDPAKAAKVTYLLGQMLAEDGGPIDRAFQAADANPLGMFSNVLHSFLNGGVTEPSSSQGATDVRQGIDVWTDPKA